MVVLLLALVITAGQNLLFLSIVYMDNDFTLSGLMIDTDSNLSLTHARNIANLQRLIKNHQITPHYIYFTKLFSY